MVSAILQSLQPTQEIRMAYLTASDNTKLYVKDWGAGRPVTYKSA